MQRPESARTAATASTTASPMSGSYRNAASQAPVLWPRAGSRRPHLRAGARRAVPGARRAVRLSPAHAGHAGGRAARPALALQAGDGDPVGARTGLHRAVDVAASLVGDARSRAAA